MTTLPSDHRIDWNNLELECKALTVNGVPYSASSSSETTVAISVSSAELKTLFSSPKEIVAAPGTGKYLELSAVRVIYNYGTVAYSNIDVGGALIFVGTTDFNNALVWFNNLFSMEEDGVVYWSASTIHYNNSPGNPPFDANAFLIARSNIENKAIVLKDDQNWTLGDGTAIVVVTYQTISLTTGLAV